MINVESIYTKLLTLTQKDGRMGLVSNDTFNQYINIAQSALFDYYVNHIDRSLIARNALYPFTVSSAYMALSTGGLVRPSEVRNLIAVNAKYVANGEAHVAACLRTRSDEIGTLQGSPIRRPNIKKHAIYFEESGDNILIHPSVGISGVSLVYLKEPVKAFRNVTQNATTLAEEYTPIGSTQLEWNIAQEDVLLQILQFIVDNELTGLTSSDLSQLLSAKSESGKSQ